MDLLKERIIRRADAFLVEKILKSRQLCKPSDGPYSDDGLS